MSAARIRLEPLAVAHLDGVRALVEDAETLRFTRVPVPTPPDFAEGWLGAYEDGRRDGTREAFAIVDGAGDFLGVALAPTIEREAATVELGYVVAPAARGHGVATEALRLLTQWAFETLRAVRLELVISVDNEPSKRVAERCGYTREGVLRSVYVKPGVREDVELWSRLATDP